MQDSKMLRWLSESDASWELETLLDERKVEG